MNIIKDGSKKEQGEAANQEWNELSPKRESCLRCGGIMVIERFQDLNDETGVINFIGRRCVLCGEVIDSTIQLNRLNQYQLCPPKGTRTRRSAPQTVQALRAKKGESS